MSAAPRTQLVEQVRALPARPGVYIFRDASGGVVYVGKAAALRNRVRSYFGSPPSPGPQTRPPAGRAPGPAGDVTPRSRGPAGRSPAGSRTMAPAISARTPPPAPCGEHWTW